MTLLEPDVALTDFALALLSAGFVVWISRFTRGDGLRRAFLFFFGAVAVAALLGGITHGYLPEHDTPLYVTFWTGSLIAIGVAAFASWVIGARLIMPDRAAQLIITLAAALLVAYIAILLVASSSFAVAVIHYLPAAIFLLIAFGIAYHRHRNRHFLAGMAGVAMTFAAAAIQQIGIGLHPVYLSHNALYHIVQGISLFLIFVAARGLLLSVPRRS